MVPLALLQLSCCLLLASSSGCGAPGNGHHDLMMLDSAVITTLAGDVSEGYVADGGEDDPAKLQIAAPPNVDWRKKGAVTPAKNQNPCGSCWAFAAVATVESQHKIRTGELVSLSEQEVLDCDHSCNGCNGGFPKDALEWIKARGGVMTEDAYPYVAYQHQYCYSKAAARRVGKIVAVRQLVAGSEAALTMAVAGQPVAVGIEANDNFQHYKSGLYTGPCTTQQNHAVVVVGYGRDAHGREYWIVKNSWGQTLGDKGFFYMRKGADGRNGLCGIVKTGGVYPVMA
ncbi:hypothetical protein ABZP36_006833 [Zizania latifolia]